MQDFSKPRPSDLVTVLFYLAHGIEKHVNAAMAHCKKLIQAIHARAFRGELVPTETELARREGRSHESAASSNSVPSKQAKRRAK